MLADDWDLGFVLPNLVLASRSATSLGVRLGDWPDGITLDSDVMALVSQDDPRVQSIAHRDPQVKRLFEGFRDGSGRSYRPALLIVRSNAADRVRRDLAAFTTFRNAAAFSFVLRARAAAAASKQHVSPGWTNTFAFHAAVITTGGRLALITDAQRALYDDSASFLGCPSSAVSICTEPLHCDHYLYRVLGEAWRRLFVGIPKQRAYLRRIFRSLEVATSAAALADANHGSLSDYGTNMSLWVSAIEILAWPTQRHSDLSAVSRLLGRFDWPSDQLSNRRFRVTWRKRALSANAVQKTYSLMYRARNRFLHGEAVSGSTLSPKVGTRPIDLLALAPTVYRTALVAYLQDCFPRREYPDQLLGFEMLDHISYSDALRVAFFGRRWQA